MQARSLYRDTSVIGGCFIPHLWPSPERYGGRAKRVDKRPSEGTTSSPWILCGYLSELPGCKRGCIDKINLGVKKFRL
jgi:hypothetical protein